MHRRYAYLMRGSAEVGEEDDFVGRRRVRSRGDRKDVLRQTKSVNRVVNGQLSKYKIVTYSLHG